MLLKEGVIEETDVRYPSLQKFNEQEFRFIACLYLQTRLNIAYEAHEKAFTDRLLDLIEFVDKDFYRKERMRRIRMRNTFIPGPVLHFLRTLAR